MARTYAVNPTKLPEGTLVELFFSAIDNHKLPNAQMAPTESGWRSISHAQLLDDVRALAAGLAQLGVKRGDRVGLLSENRPEWALTDYAMLTMGALNVPLYGTLPSNQIEFILRDSGAKGVLVSNADQLAKIEEIAGNLPDLEFIIAFDPIPKPGPRVKQLSAVLAAGRAQRPEEAAFRADALQARPDDIATLIYTSGTTGQPKGVMLTHNNIFSNVQAQAWLASGKGNDVTLSFLPLSHIFQRMVDYCTFYNGVPIAYVPAIDAVVKSMGEIKPTLVVAVPRVYEKIYDRIMSATGLKRKLVLLARRAALDWADALTKGQKPGLGLRLRHGIFDKLVFSKIRALLGGRLRFFVSGGAPLAPHLAFFFYGAGVLILEGYGLTETSPVTNVNRPDAFRFGTVGKPIANTEIKLAEDGEILVRGPQIMKGYYKNPEATAEVIDADGWFRTGDIGVLDDDDYLSITDRKKELIKTAGGKFVAPAPIQNLAKLSRMVADAMVVGDRRPYPIMLVVPNFANLEQWAAQEGIRWANRQELVADARVRQKMEEEVLHRLQGLARYEMPKKFLILEREFELDRGEITAKMSLKRKVIEEHFKDGIEALYADATVEAAS